MLKFVSTSSDHGLKIAVSGLIPTALVDDPSINQGCWYLEQGRSGAWYDGLNIRGRVNSGPVMARMDSTTNQMII